MAKGGVKGLGEQIRRPMTIRERTQAGRLAARAGDRLGGQPKAHALGTEAGDALAYVKQLSGEALTHRAVCHPYLQALAEGKVPDARWAMADFARQYYGYSSHFLRYLTAVMSRLVDAGHRRALLDNLAEESGCTARKSMRSWRASG